VLTENEQEVRRHIDRRAALDAAKLASEVSTGLARHLFAAIVHKDRPELTEAQIDEGYQIYLSLSGRSVPLVDPPH